tara:strand:- start:982 stop:1326 length:345 start_codon:yes stop_codon:yes gene_type:complete
MLNFVGSVDKAERVVREAGAYARRERAAMESKKLALAAVAAAPAAERHWVWSGELFMRSQSAEALQRDLAAEIAAHAAGAAAAERDEAAAHASLAAMQRGTAAAERGAALKRET